MLSIEFVTNQGHWQTFTREIIEDKTLRKLFAELLLGGSAADDIGVYAENLPYCMFCVMHVEVVPYLAIGE